MAWKNLKQNRPILLTSRGCGIAVVQGLDEYEKVGNRVGKWQGYNSLINVSINLLVKGLSSRLIIGEFIKTGAAWSQ